MDLLFNEFSCYPLAENDCEAEKRFSQLYKTFKKAETTFGFERIVVKSDFHKQDLTVEKNFYESVCSLSNPNLIDNLLSLFKKPFADDLEEEELDAFCEGSYEIADKAVPTQQGPVGLAIAYLERTPTLSFDAHEFWRNRKIRLQRARTAKPEYKTGKNEALHVYNLCLETDLEESEIREWWDATKLGEIHSEETLRAYLSYSKYQVAFDKGFVDEILKWKEEDSVLFERIICLMRNIDPDRFTARIGKAEKLKNIKGGFAKRITDEHRLVYCLKKDTVTFIACKGHYGDH